MTDTPNPPNLPPTSAPPLAAKKSRWLLYGCGTLLALLLLIILTVVITLWWIQRPIKPVVLSAGEKASVEEKLRPVSGGNGAAGNSAPRTTQSAPSRTTKPNTDLAESRAYAAGSKIIKLTEHEINGLLNANTDLGNSVRLEFAKDAVNAYVAVPIPQDFPIGGGRMFRARGRFALSVGNSGAPYAILEDVTILGVSLPKAWLGGLKGQNLIGQAIGEPKGSPIRGIKSLRVEPGALVLELED